MLFCPVYPFVTLVFFNPLSFEIPLVYLFYVYYYGFST